MGFFSNLFKRITQAQTSMGDSMIRLGKETGHLDLTRDAAESAYKTAASAREMDNLTSAVENKVTSHFQKVKAGRNSYTVKFDYNQKQSNGATEADLDFLKPKEGPIELTEEQKKIAETATISRGTYGQMQSLVKDSNKHAGMTLEEATGGNDSPFHEDAYGRIFLDTQTTLSQPSPREFSTQLTHFYDMYKSNGAILTSDGSFIKGDDADIHMVTVEAVSTGLKPMGLYDIAQKAEEAALDVERSTDQIISDAKQEGAFAVHPKQTEAEIRMLAKRVMEISKEIEQEMENLQVKSELKQEIFGWIKEAANQKNRYICAEIQNAIIFISNQLDTDKINDPSIKNPSVIIAGLDDRGVPEKLIQFNTIEECRREMGSTGEKFTDMSMLRELSHASREFERIAQLTNSEHIDDVVYRLEKAMQDYETDIKFEGAEAIVDKVIESNNLREEAYERIKSIVESRILGDSEFIKQNYPEKYEAFFKEVGSIYMGCNGGIANIDVMPVEHVVNFDEAKNGAEPIKDMSFMLTVTDKDGKMASINYDSNMKVQRIALGEVEQEEHSINWSSANMQLAFDAKEGFMNGFDNTDSFAKSLIPLQNAIKQYEKENPQKIDPEIEKNNDEYERE